MKAAIDGAAMQSLVNASVFMIVLNEEHRIALALKSVEQFREVLVLDSGSTDRTVEIAESFNNASVIHQPWLGFSAQKQAALEACSSEWLLNLDADEILTPEYLTAVEELILADTSDALKGPRRLLHWNKPVRSFRRDEQLIRCFRRGKGRYDQCRVHEGIVVEGSVASTDALILHHEDLSFEQRLAKSKRYSSLRAMDKFDQGDRANVLHLLFMFPLTFIHSYLLRGNFLGGVGGFQISVDDAYYAFKKYAKLRELCLGRSVADKASL